MNLEPNQLPPRRSRHTQRKVNFSFIKWVRSGLVVFGAVFFGVILVELYQAQVSHEAAKPSTSVLTVSEPTTDNIASAGQAENAAGKDRGAAASTPTVQEAKTTPETKDAKLDPPPVSTPSVQPASQPSTTGEPKTTPTASVPVKPTNTSAASASAPAPKPKAIRHVVQKGETLYMLSRKYYGNNLNVSRIAKYNGFHADTQLTAGKIVMVPLAP